MQSLIDTYRTSDIHIGRRIYISDDVGYTYRTSDIDIGRRIYNSDIGYTIRTSDNNSDVGYTISNIWGLYQTLHKCANSIAVILY